MPTVFLFINQCRLVGVLYSTQTNGQHPLMFLWLLQLYVFQGKQQEEKGRQLASLSAMRDDQKCDCSLPAPNCVVL